MGSPAGISSSMDAAASISASRSSSIRRWPSSAGRTTRRRSATMFRKSYRKLLRWNDEFPFVKFSVAEDERPVLAIEIPLPRPTPTRSGSRSPGSWASPTRLLDETKGWLWIGGGCPAPVTGRRPTPRSSIGTRAGSRRSSGTGVVSRRLAALVLALVAAAGLARSPAGTPRSGPRAPTSRSSRDARYDVQPEQHRGPGDARHGAHEPPQGHDHQALLLRPGLPGGAAGRIGTEAHLDRCRQRRGVGLEVDRRPPRSCGSSSGPACTAGSRATYTLRSTSSTAAGRPTR